MGTHGGQNRPQTFTCSLVGSYLALAATKHQREAAGDVRLSIAERYRDRNDYVNRIRVAALELMRLGFLLSQDAAVIIQAAAVHAAFGPPTPNAAPR